MSMYMLDLNKPREIYMSMILVPTENELIRYAARRRWQVELCATRRVSQAGQVSNTQKY